jgi:hypothetical protein
VRTVVAVCVRYHGLGLESERELTATLVAKAQTGALGCEGIGSA